MSKILNVTLTDIEYEILKKVTIVEGEEGEKLKNLLRYYIFTLPELKSAEYALKRVENKEEIESYLREVWAAYELTENPTEVWKEDKIKKLSSDLIEINVLLKTGEQQYVPGNKFRSLYKMVLHDVATESKDMDEYSAACVATIQLLMEFGADVLSKETIRDATIFLNEGWLFIYATAMKKARDFMKTKKLFPEEVHIAASE
ncbi:MAG: hypothetical protein KKG76_09555 [Euryarchaeota archaeon]|nr:hypothetical protein [Euryarchaeota archaeon]MBU4138359.1 hypothetical protein [Euryarchaeota archaeon]